MRFRPLPLVACSVLLASAVVPLAGGRQLAVGPHDLPSREIEVAEYWLPRHRAALAARGLTPAAAPVDSRAARKLRFTRPRRVSQDLLAPPPPSLPTAQAETQTEPYLAVDPEDPDHLLAGWQENRFTDGGARALGYAVSTDGGRTWTEGRLPGLTTVDGGPWPRASDPWPAFGPNGRAYYASLLVTEIGSDNGVGVSVSEDGGLTWSDPVEVFRSNADFNDKEALVVDTFPNSPHFGDVYVAWDINVAGGGGFVAQRMVVARSTNRGKRWRQPVELRSGFTNIGIIPRVGPDGTVYAIWAAGEPGDPSLRLLFARSTDGGRSWSQPAKIADMLGVGVPGFRSGTILPSFAVDPNDGALYAAWADARFSGVDQAALSVSTDGGASWSAPVRVSDGPAGVPVFTVGVATNDAGEVAVGYYTLRNDGGERTMVDYYVNVSRDHGASFRKGVRVSRRSSDARAAARAGQSLSFFLGDYVGLAGGGTRFFALWTATRKKSQLRPGRQPDIFAAGTR